MEEITKTQPCCSKCKEIMSKWWVKSLIGFIVLVVVFAVGALFGSFGNYKNGSCSSNYRGEMMQKQRFYEGRGNRQDFRQIPNQGIPQINQENSPEVLPNTSPKAPETLNNQVPAVEVQPVK